MSLSHLWAARWPCPSPPRRGGACPPAWSPRSSPGTWPGGPARSWSPALPTQTRGTQRGRGPGPRQAPPRWPRRCFGTRTPLPPPCPQSPPSSRLEMKIQSNFVQDYFIGKPNKLGNGNSSSESKTKDLNCLESWILNIFIKKNPSWLNF